jgi:hypothetical protein
LAYADFVNPINGIRSLREFPSKNQLPKKNIMLDATKKEVIK